MSTRFLFLFGLVLVLVLSLTLQGCGGDEDEDKKKKDGKNDDDDDDDTEEENTKKPKNDADSEKEKKKKELTQQSTQSSLLRLSAKTALRKQEQWEQWEKGQQESSARSEYALSDQSAEHQLASALAAGQSSASEISSSPKLRGPPAPGLAANLKQHSSEVPKDVNRHDQGKKKRLREA